MQIAAPSSIDSKHIVRDDRSIHFMNGRRELRDLSGQHRSQRSEVPIEGLVTKEGGATDLAELKGKTIGVKGDLPPSIVALLAKAGLKRGTDYQELLLDGFDPVAQLDSAIDAAPSWPVGKMSQRYGRRPA